MAGVYRRGTDKERGKAGRYTAWWLGPDGKRKSRVAYTDRAASLQFAREQETQAALIRDGLVDPAEQARRQAALRSIEDHIEDYRRQLLAKGDTSSHARHVFGTLRRIFADAAVDATTALAADRIAEALARLRAVRSARTANHALGCVRAFVRWLAEAGRIKDVPPGIRALRPVPELADRRRVRRALSGDELARLVQAAHDGPAIEAFRGPRGQSQRIVWLTGPDRAMLYRLAMGTGFRAAELRSLTPESFRLDGDSPSIVVRACYSKRGKRSGRDDVQPIRADLAAALQAWLVGRPDGQPVLPVPTKTAQMLRADLDRAGIPHRDATGRVIDFHALRHSYITDLVRKGVNPKIVQTLARHSTITLTLDRYTTLDDSDAREAIEQ